jgi:hypothetical protein
MRAVPNTVTAVRLNRAFLVRAVRFLAAECGIRQFLDIGTGLPSANNTHEVAQAIAPDARVMYVDNDPIVLAHARALLVGRTEGTVTYLDADLRDPDRIVQAAYQKLDFRQPIGLMLLSVLHLIPDADEPGQAVGRLVDALPSGSYLVLSHLPSDVLPEGVAEMEQRLNALSPIESITARSHDQVAQFFSGLDIVPPGLVQAHQWRPDEYVAQGEQVSMWCAVARKP